MGLQGRAVEMVIQCTLWASGSLSSGGSKDRPGREKSQAEPTWNHTMGQHGGKMETCRVGEVWKACGHASKPQ